MLLNNQYSFTDYPVFTKELNDLSSSILKKESSILVNTLNQYSYCIANVDSEFKESLQKSDILLADGIGVVAASRLLTGKKITKIAGADLHQFLLNDLNRNSGSCFYLGASQETLTKIKDKLAVEYPNIKVGFFAPPFKEQFSDEDNSAMVSAVNTFNPDVLFVGMTAPKQEKWAYKHKPQLNANIICTIGAVFDFYAGTVKRPNKIWINMGLEWFVRLVHEPKRLWKRYLYFGPIFVALILTQVIKRQSNKKLMANVC
ncbi:WecB/TagA/CpsF family glycosyltransferase [Mucilaginibacter polytrichastri]|uniref:N-acetylglucosaminyldiphosphoundecaprenol N-acetyl-beta-D-mannosaminyltransferase n=1 Tax=Mucilaginibacter polytrichastri TaxID=1302689 RepID=A0A1Q5ZXB6_9SPHI|nr:WecB/TagA/CpsF family glycosyltransferase [Mucilaginibacter polytrichastri]OKS86391.1 hypothetical protein RG47T_1847 [Mucilaginibacter polytrichastri]SFT20740.1 N-acetylglucosaminyldiphosphoundecaprenol N-acetyl-beta-D-mannosaminyltransferase [Mucilaginibacter polytrichastri]